MHSLLTDTHPIEIAGLRVAFGAEPGPRVRGRGPLARQGMAARHDNRSPKLGTSVSIIVRPGRRTVSVLILYHRWARHDD